MIGLKLEIYVIKFIVKQILYQLYDFITPAYNTSALALWRVLWQENGVGKIHESAIGSPRHHERTHRRQVMPVHQTCHPHSKCPENSATFWIQNNFSCRKSGLWFSLRSPTLNLLLDSQKRTKCSKFPSLRFCSCSTTRVRNFVLATNNPTSLAWITSHWESIVWWELRLSVLVLREAVIISYHG